MKRINRSEQWLILAALAAPLAFGACKKQEDPGDAVEEAAEIRAEKIVERAEERADRIEARGDQVEEQYDEAREDVEAAVDSAEEKQEFANEARERMADLEKRIQELKNKGPAPKLEPFMARIDAERTQVERNMAALSSAPATGWEPQKEALEKNLDQIESVLDEAEDAID